jgi:hypothetical protein
MAACKPASRSFGGPLVRTFQHLFSCLYGCGGGLGSKFDYLLAELYQLVTFEQ